MWLKGMHSARVCHARRLANMVLAEKTFGMPKAPLSIRDFSVLLHRPTSQGNHSGNSVVARGTKKIVLSSFFVPMACVSLFSAVEPRSLFLAPLARGASCGTGWPSVKRVILSSGYDRPSNQVPPSFFFNGGTQGLANWAVDLFCCRAVCV